MLDVCIESFAPEILLCLSLFRELASDRGPRRGPGVVVAGLKERVEATHAMKAAKPILERELQRVAERQRPRDVGRWVHHDERLALRVRICRVEAFVLPDLLPARLDFGGLVERFHQRPTA